MDQRNFIKYVVISTALTGCKKDDYSTKLRERDNLRKKIQESSKDMFERNAEIFVIASISDVPDKTSIMEDALNEMIKYNKRPYGQNDDKQTQTLKSFLPIMENHYTQKGTPERFNNYTETQSSL